MEEIIRYQKEKKNVFVHVLCALMDKRTLIMLESKHYLTVTIIWTKTAIASIMMRGTPEIQIKKNWNASIVLIALNVFVIRSKNKNTKIH